MMDQPARPQMNLLHPLASLEWRECSRMPLGMSDAQAVVLGGKVYVGGGELSTLFNCLLVYDFNIDKWSILRTPVYYYTLATYRSQLVVIGGKSSTSGQDTNKLWVLDEHLHSFTFMPTKRSDSSSVAVGSHLIVAGGNSNDDLHISLDVVEVYDGKKWNKVQSLPKACYEMKSAVHKGNWYLAGGVTQGREVLYASLESLVATTHMEGTEQIAVWKKLTDTPFVHSTLVAFGKQLITMGGQPLTSAIHAFSYNTNSWVYVGDLPVACHSVCTVVLPTGELLVIGGETDEGKSSRVFKANIGVTPYPDGQFSISALHRLEGVAGISISYKLADDYLLVASALEFDQSTHSNLTKTEDTEEVEAVFKEWLSGKSSLPPTWHILQDILQAIQMKELAQSIDDFFNKTPVTKDFSEPELSRTQEELKSTTFESKDGLSMPNCWDVAVQSSPDCHHVAVQTCGEATIGETTGLIRGTEVVGITDFTILTQGGSFEWRGYGLRLHVAGGSLPAGIGECRINIKASLSGQFELPQGSDLLSPIFWISTPCEFTKPVTLEIQHCALGEDETVMSDLSFVSARCSQKELPYRFRQMDGGVFTTYSSYGSIQLSHFSGIGITGRKRTPQSYCAQIYYTHKGMHHWRFYFVVTRDLEIQMRAVKEHYGHFAQRDTALKVTFQRSQITLDIPADGMMVQDGWRIAPRSHPTISKKDADCFVPGQWIPECELVVEWREQKQPTRLWHKVFLTGAKAPGNYFNLVLDPTEGRILTLQQATSALDKHSTVVDECVPSKPTLRDLMDALYHKVADNWKVIGVHLEISDLASIEVKHNSDPHRCLLEMLETWLKKVDSSATWSAMIEALEFLGEKQLATELKEKHCC